MLAPSQYHQWQRDWPPLAGAILQAAEQTGAALAITGNLYGLGAQSHLGDREIPPLLAGKRVRVIGSLDAPHSWTYVPDVSQTLVTLVTVAADERAWGRAWLVPSNPPLTQRDALESIAARAGVSPPKLSSVLRPVLRAIGLLSPAVRELGEVLGQFESPFVVDASETTKTFGIEPTPWTEVVDAVLGASRETPVRV